jgi:dipeptidyl aminopeptidase/acylaminoacyl peptidase
VKGETFQMTGNIAYRYRPASSRDWQDLGTLNTVTDNGFNPYAVDPRGNVVYGLKKREGRQALFARSLDGSNLETLVFARPDVDVSGIARIGRDQRVVGATYITDRRVTEYFDPAVKALVTSLSKALPMLPQVDVTDASNDEQRLLIHAAADDDPGRYYLFDRGTKTLQVLMQDRPQLAGRKLAKVQSVRYSAADGTMIPAYLTLPPEGPRKGLPAIVMPHGGPSARDEWGFDWLAQFFAARGYAVIQPNFRGSSGYGEAYLMQNGFRAWRTAISDVDDAGRWLAAQGIADKDRMAIFGWSYGGYAALQSGVVEPGLFKAIVAIAPVTDLSLLKDDLLNWSNYRVTSDYIGSIGPAASPAQNAGKIAAPVLLVHGTLDANVAYRQSTTMEGRLRAAGKRVEMMTFEGLDHQLEDGSARAKMLERADGFIRAALGG